MKRIPPRLLHNARALRAGMTDTEKALWQQLRKRNLAGHRFRRQHPLSGHIVDFVCLERKLIIEVDGGQHLESAADRRRDRQMRELGFRVLRFWNNEVLLNMDGVLEVILEALEE